MTTVPMIETDGRSVPEWVGDTADTPAPPRVRLRVLKRFKYTCQECTRPIEAGTRWICDHTKAIANGGENRERNLRPICCWCDRTIKTPADVKVKARGDSIQKRRYGLKESRNPMPGSRRSKYKKKMDGRVVLR